MSGKRPTDHLEPAAKKRGSERQISKDDNEEEEDHVEPGTFARASEDVIKQRKIIKARRAAPTAPASTNPFSNVQLASTTAPPAASNPFSGISLIPPSAPKPTAAIEETKDKETKDEETKDEETKNQEEKKTTTTTAPSMPTTTFGATGGFGALSSGAGLSFGTSTGGFGALANTTTTTTTTTAGATTTMGSGFGGFAGLASTAGGVAFGSSTAGIAGGPSTTPPVAPLFGGSTTAATGGLAFGGNQEKKEEKEKDTDENKNHDDLEKGHDNNGQGQVHQTPDDNNKQDQPSTTSIFGSAVPSSGTALFGTVPRPAPSLPKEVSIATGEEDEHTVFSSDGVLFEYDANKQWKERCRGEIRVNVENKAGGHARLIMRQKGNFRLLLNAKLWAGMLVTKMEGSTSVTFACVNHLAEDGDDGKLATYALRIKGVEKLEEFIKVIEENKEKID